MKAWKKKFILLLNLFAVSTILEPSSANAMIQDSLIFAKQSRFILKRNYTSQTPIQTTKEIDDPCLTLPPTPKTLDKVSVETRKKPLTLGDLFKRQYKKLGITATDDLDTRAEKLKKITNRKLLTSKDSLSDSIACVEKNCYKTFLNFTDLLSHEVAEKTSEKARNILNLAREIDDASTQKEKLTLLRRDFNFRDDIVQFGDGWSKQVEVLQEQIINNPLTSNYTKKAINELVASIYNIDALDFNSTMYFYNKSRE